jgi:hypothetical protein
MKKIARILLIVIEISGPLVVSFGTFQGLILFLEIFFFQEIKKADYYWIYILYFLALCVSIIISFYKTLDKEAERKEDNPNIEVTSSQPKRGVSTFLYGSISSALKWYLETKKITFCDVFSRPSHWDLFPNEHKDYPIIRMLKEKVSYEIRYPKGKKGKLLIRFTDKELGNYGDFREASMMQWREVFVLAPFTSIIQLFIG